ncbi:MAG: CoA pyrophosphatase [Gammaproteobacteria bacterium]
MNSRSHFYARLEALCEREVQCFPPDIFPAYYRTAAVLLLLWAEQNGAVKLALTRRTNTLPSHKGHVSFPGGGMLETDPSPEVTALRETEEELGIRPQDIRVMGRLDDAWSRAGFHIIPYVGWTDRPPVFNPDPREVDDIIVADVATLMQPEISCVHEVAETDQQRTTHAFSWDGGYVWGVTADILLELLLWIQGESSNRRDCRLDLMKKQLEAMNR